MKNNSLLAWGLIILILAALAIVQIGGSWNGMMGPGWGMMGDWLIPSVVGIVVLIGMGLVWLDWSGYGMTNMVEPPCPNCGFRPIIHSAYCPNCGKTLN